jgi:glycogen debranching enzyme
MAQQQQTILEGSTFCICDDRGDVTDVTHGLFVDDTRFLSKLALTVDGERPLLLSGGTVEYFSAAYFLRNPRDELSIKRERFVGEGMQDCVTLTNVSTRRLDVRVGIELGADFADIISVKEWDFSLGDPTTAAPLPEPVRAQYDGSLDRFTLVDPDGFGTTHVRFSQPGAESDGRGVAFAVSLEPRACWTLRIDVFAGEDEPAFGDVHFGDERQRVSDSLSAWRVRVPQLRASWLDLQLSFERSVADLAALRMRSEGAGRLPAAGMPWFMAVFGRDTLITCLQTLLFGSELARGALRELAALQATDDDPSRDAEPGKIVHEVRHGKCAARWFDRYYGTVDATPLFLVLLSETWRWTGDDALVLELRGPALAALRWIDSHPGFVTYERRTPRGLENQSWKDSGDSQRFRDGSLARTPIAPCEVQGYVYDAKRRLAEIARDAWRDAELAERLERDAADLRGRFDDAFWVDDGEYYALALDGDGRRVDSLCSNIGHLLWSGIVPPERVPAIVDRLVSPTLFSGWGVRTMSDEDAAFSPLSYHNGTVWPHDNSLCAWGLARHARWPEAQQIARAMIDAAASFDHRLPEVFAGFSRSDTPFPIAYPTAARPQAWAAGTPVLLLQVLLGLQPDRRRQTLESVAPLELPSWLGELRLTGIQAFGGVWDVVVEDGGVTVSRA